MRSSASSRPCASSSRARACAASRRPHRGRRPRAVPLPRAPPGRPPRGPAGRARSSCALRNASTARASARRARSSVSAVSPSVSRIAARSPRIPLALRQARPGVGHDLLGQAEPLGDRERLAAAGQADRQAIGRRERLEIELDRRVARPIGRVGVRLQLGVVGRGRDERAGPDEVVEQRLGQRRALGRVRAGAQLVEQHERARPGGLDDRVIA